MWGGRQVQASKPSGVSKDRKQPKRVEDALGGSVQVLDTAAHSACSAAQPLPPKVQEVLQELLEV